MAFVLKQGLKQRLFPTIDRTSTMEHSVDSARAAMGTDGLIKQDFGFTVKYMLKLKLGQGSSHFVRELGVYL